MKTYIVTEAHKKEVVFEGKRTEVKKFIKNAHRRGNIDPMNWDVSQLLSNNIASYGRVWGGDFIESGYKLN